MSLRTLILAAGALGALALFGAAAACKSSGTSSTSRICTLTPDKTTFICDVEFLPERGVCEPTSAARREFIARMTSVTLDMLYLEREAGGQPPFRHNDVEKAASSIEIIACRSGCECRMRFTDPSLEEIFYDSAGCRRDSKYASHPLYFRGRGCR